MNEQDSINPLESISEAEYIVRDILLQYHYPADQFTLDGFQFFQLANLRGLIAAINTPVSSFLIANMPLIALPYHNKFLTHVELMEILLNVSKVEDVQFALNEQAVNFILCRQTLPLSENEVAQSIQRIFTTTRRVRSQMIAAMDYVYPESTKPYKDSSPFDILPAIPMLPKQMNSLYKILNCCPQNVQSIFRFMMENWVKMNGSLTINQKAVHLYCKTGMRQLRMASLLPPDKGDISTIHLVWDRQLQKYQESEKVLAEFQEQVNRISSLRVTGSQAVLRVRDSFTLQKAGELLNALAQLSSTLQANNLEHSSQPAIRKVTVQNFLDHLDLHDKEIILPLIAAWKKEEGKLKVSRLDSLHLILETSHASVGETMIEPAAVKLITIKTSPGSEVMIKIFLQRPNTPSPFFYIPAAVQKYRTAIQSVAGEMPIQHDMAVIPLRLLNSSQVRIIQIAICDLLHAERLAGFN
ncbi:MAG: hypothetical protein ABFD58_02805 [Anaerolineaceae bacterium]